MTSLNEAEMYEVILYYNFSKLEDPEAFCKEHKSFLKSLGVKGRVYVGEEGINGTLAGTPDQMDQYKRYLRGIQGFEKTAFKNDKANFIPFAKLICKVRREIVSIHVDGLDPAEGGNYLPPARWREVLE